MSLNTVLGIMALYYNDHRKLEERSYFKQLTQSGAKMGIDIFVFTPADIHWSQKRMHAHYYDLQTLKWKRQWRSIPSLIFDRCRYQPNKRFKQLRKFRARFPQLTYLNRPLANKWNIHQILNKNPQFRPHLPRTRKYRGYSDALHMLATKRTIYLKPVNGTGGRGILRIQKRGKLFHIQGRDQRRRIVPAHSVSKANLSAKLKAWNINKPLLIQQGIDLKLNNGRVHDYRLLMQKNRNGVWEVTGCAGRIGAKHSITSNLHGGGKAVSMKNLLKQWFSDESTRQSIQNKVYQFGHNVVHEIENKFGRLCELALDIAIDRSGHIWLIEINPKPSREVFSKIGEPDTYKKAIKRPLEYALWLDEQE